MDTKPALPYQSRFLSNHQYLEYATFIITTKFL